MTVDPWKVERDLDGDAVHIRPRADLRWHLLGACWCNPCVETTASGPLVIHHAADGRPRLDQITAVAPGPTDQWH